MDEKSLAAIAIVTFVTVGRNPVRSVCIASLWTVDEQGRKAERLPEITIEAENGTWLSVYTAVLRAQDEAARLKLKLTVLLKLEKIRGILQTLADQTQRRLWTGSGKRAHSELLRQIWDHPTRPAFGNVLKPQYRRVLDEITDKARSMLASR